MQKYSKLSLIYFITIILIVIPYSIIAIYLHDPLQVWHKPLFRKNVTYSNSIRESAKAMIRDLEFDSIIIGNSHSENTSCKEAQNILGGKFINLSISGSTLYEKNLILTYILKRKKIKQIVYLLDEHYLTLSKEPLRYDTGQYSFLYNDDPLDDFKIYLNPKYLFRTIFFSNSEKCIGKTLNPDKPYAWDDKPFHTKRFDGFENWINNKNNDQIKSYFDSVLKAPLDINKKEISEKYKKDLHKYIDDYLLITIAQAPDTNFYLVISPVSDIELALRLRDDRQFYAKQKELLKYLISKQDDYKNFKIFAFNNDPKLSEIKDFKDGTHYRTWINTYILNSLTNNKYEISKNNVDKYLNDVYNRALNFNYEYYYNQIQTSRNSRSKN